MAKCQANGACRRADLTLCSSCHIAQVLLSQHHHVQQRRACTFGVYMPRGLCGTVDLCRSSLVPVGAILLSPARAALGPGEDAGGVCPERAAGAGVGAQTVARLEQDTAYPGWQPDTGSAVLQLTREVLEQLTGHPPKVRADGGAAVPGVRAWAQPAGWARARARSTATRGHACRARRASLLTAAAATACLLIYGPVRCLAGRGA